jgi:hypothetical protein
MRGGCHWSVCICPRRVCGGVCLCVCVCVCGRLCTHTHTPHLVEGKCVSGLGHFTAVSHLGFPHYDVHTQSGPHRGKRTHHPTQINPLVPVLGVCVTMLYVAPYIVSISWVNRTGHGPVTLNLPSCHHFDCDPCPNFSRFLFFVSAVPPSRALQSDIVMAFLSSKPVSAIHPLRCVIPFSLSG